MNEHITVKNELPAPGEERIAFSNAVRLSGRQWLGVLLVVAIFVFAGPTLWTRVEDFTLEPDYRVPRKLRDDYWFFERYAALAAEQCDVLVLGDSVVWGEFVNRHETLSHYLNDAAKGGKARERFANLGLNASHPLALEGLIENYARSIAGKNVLLQCNPTWLRDLKTDLQDVDVEVSHPRLVPQFWPRIPAYKEEISPRLGVLVERHMAVSKWSNHLQQAYYRLEDTSDIPSWTLKNPYADPLEPLYQGLPASDSSRRDDARPWFKRDITRQDVTWIDLDTSLQWHAFQRTVELLQRRGNRVFVLVGPLNEHMLTPASLQRYHKVKDTITAWLQAKQVAHLAPAALPSEWYADASHPLAEGYALLARRVLEDSFFQEKSR